MKIAGLIRDSLVNGVGLRDVIFMQGCPHHCEGCQNPHTWNPDGGIEMTVDEIVNELKDSSNNITLSGGEPFMNKTQLLDLVFKINEEFPTKTIWIYTGYKLEELSPWVLAVLSMRNVEVIVDGEFIEKLKDSNLQFRGSSNQRLIDLQRSYREDKIILWEDTNEK